MYKPFWFSPGCQGFWPISDLHVALRKLAGDSRVRAILGQLNGHSEGHKFYYNLKTKTSHWLQEHAEQQPDAGNSNNKPKLSICFIVQKTFDLLPKSQKLVLVIVT